MCMEKSGCAKYGFWALRLTVGAVFIYSGWMKLSNMDTTVAMFGQLGFPMAAFWAWLVALVEFVGGIAVVLGVATHFFAMLLAIIMVVALIGVHRKMPFQSAIAPITLLGSTLALMCLGGGPGQLWKKGCKNGCCLNKGVEKKEIAASEESEDACCGSKEQRGGGCCKDE